MSYRLSVVPIRRDAGTNYDFGYKADINTCEQCGALVMDLTAHDRWHSDVEADRA